MGDKRARRMVRQAEVAAGAGVVKVTLRLDELVVKRLGVEAVMTGKSQSHIVNAVLAKYLAGWRLPSKTGGVGDPADGTESAA